MKSLIPRRREMRLPNARLNEYPSLLNLRDQLDKFFAEEFTNWPMFEAALLDEELSDFVPKVDMHETEKELIVVAEFPGMHEDQIEICLEDGVLVMKGEKIEDKKWDVKGHYRMERSFGKFQRSMPLPCKIDEKLVEAFFHNGVITVVMPKIIHPMAAEKKIAIKPMP